MPRKKSHSRLGKVFEQEISRSLRAFKNRHPNTFFWHRLSDTMSYIQVPNVIMPKQPGDFIALYRGVFYLIECKSMHVDRFDMDHLLPHQREGLAQVVKAGGRGVLLFSFRRKRPVSCYAIHYFDYKAVEDALKQERKSIPRDALEEVGIRLERIPRVGWDLSRVFEGCLSE